MNGKLIFNQMKKLFLVIALIATTFAAMAQSEIVSGRIIAHSTSTQTMVWSQSDQKTITVPDRERFQEDNLIELNLNTQNSSGKCTITNIADGAVYSFNIYDYELHPDQISDSGLIYDTLVLNCIESSTSNKVRIIYLSYKDSSFRLVSVFMPSENLIVHMDTER